MHPLRIRRSARRKRGERKGSGTWAPGTGVKAGRLVSGTGPGGGSAGASIGSGVDSVLGSASGGALHAPGLWGSVISFVSRATGMSVVTASKAGIVALTLAATTVAAGMTLWWGGSQPSAPMTGSGLGRTVFPKNDAAGNGAAALGKQTLAPDASSLDYLKEANPGEARDAVEDKGDAQEDNKEWAEVLEKVEAKAEAKTARAPAGPRPKLVPGQPFSARGATGGMQVALKPVPGLTDKVGNGFQEIYHQPKADAFDKAQYRARQGAKRRRPLVAGGKSAMEQARFANRMSRQGARMGQADSAATAASTPFDGGNAGSESLGATSPGGAHTQGAGITSGPSGVLDQKSIEEPPPPEEVQEAENKTPYQNLIYAGMGALAIGALLLMIAGQLVSKARSTPGPQAAALLS
ncbi:MAG: hypothetical protein ABII00_01055 [Elusimicrobiota bacterium]